jgi:hypothetical protein
MSSYTKQRPALSDVVRLLSSPDREIESIPQLLDQQYAVLRFVSIFHARPQFASRTALIFFIPAQGRLSH